MPATVAKARRRWPFSIRWLRRQARRLEVVGHHVADARALPGRGAAVVAHDHHAALDRRLEVALVGKRRDDDDAAHAVRQQVLEERALLGPVAVGAADQQAVAEPLLRAGLDLARDVAVHRIGHRGHEQAEQRRLPGLELARQAVGREAQRLDRRLDPRQRLRPHPVGAAVEHVRHRAHRNGSVAGDVLDRGHGSWCGRGFQHGGGRRCGARRRIVNCRGSASARRTPG